MTEIKKHLVVPTDDGFHRWGLPGSTVRGVLEAVEQGLFGPIYIIRAGSSAIRVPATHYLSRVLPQIALGTPIEIVYIGQRAIPEGKTVKDFEVYVLETDPTSTEPPF